MSKKLTLPPLPIRERQQRVLELRESGMSPAIIARETGASPALVYADLKAILQRTQALEDDLADHYRRVELQRLDSMQQAWWARATGAATREDGSLVPADEKAAQVVLRIMERRAKLLGIDAPVVTKSEVDLRFGDRLDLIIERGSATIDANRERRETFMQSDEGQPRLESPRIRFSAQQDIDADVIDISPDSELTLVDSGLTLIDSELTLDPRADVAATEGGSPVSPDAEGGEGYAPLSVYGDNFQKLPEVLSDEE